MAPIRRYLRISRYSVLEVRIYLDNPADAYRWLLKTSDPALPRVIEAVRPYVIPKLKEENERARKGSKKKSVKDVVVRDEFEVSIFLTDLSTSHSILSKHKVFPSKSNQGNTGTKDAPVDVDDGDEAMIQDEDDEDNVVELKDVPRADSSERKEISEEESEAFGTQPSSPIRPQATEPLIVEDDDDQKKKEAFVTTFDGFRIYGRILCLVVKRKTASKGKSLEGGPGKAMMEEWISSTQTGGAVPLDD